MKRRDRGVASATPDPGAAAAPRTAPDKLVDAIAYAIARAPVPGKTDTAVDVARRLAPLVIESGYLAPRAAESGASRHGPWCVKTGPDSDTPIVHDEDCRRDDTPAESGASPAAEDRGLAALREADLDAAWDAHLTEELGSGHECSRYCAEDLVRFYNAALPHGEPARTPLDRDRLAAAIAAAWRTAPDHSTFGPGLTEGGRDLAVLIADEWDR